MNPASSTQPAAAVAAPQVPATTAAAPIPFRRDDGGTASALGGGGIGVLVISLLAIAVVLFLRRKFNLHTGSPPKGRLVHVVESTRLGPRALLSVVEFDGTRYLIAQSEHGITSLAEKPVDTARESM